MVVRAPAWQEAYRAVRENAALLSLVDSGLLEVTGTERTGYVHDLVTNDVASLGPGQGVRAMMLTPTKGRVVADFLVCSTPEALWIECFGGSAPAVLELLEKFYFGQEVTFSDRSAAYSVLSLQGPRSGAVLQTVGAAVPGPSAGANEETTIGDRDVRVVRWTDTGEVGFHLWAAVGEAPAIAAELISGGAVEGTHEAWDVLQIEAGIAVFGRDLSEDIIPLEAPTENAISHTKGCYPGQEVIARLWARGRPAKHLRGMRFEGEAMPAAGSVFDADDKSGVARVTASAASPDLGSIGLAYIHRDYCQPGTKLIGEMGPAEVVEIPMREVVEQ